jgi:formate dehydrogenase maturation protein FdhE
MYLSVDVDLRVMEEDEDGVCPFCVVVNMGVSLVETGMSHSVSRLSTLVVCHTQWTMAPPFHTHTQ